MSSQPDQWHSHLFRSTSNFTCLNSRRSGILLPTTVPPTFTRLSGVSVSVDEARGTFALQLSAELDRPGQVFYSLYR